MKVHCLFEQSGTFKTQFNELGFDAYDYDILDDFGQTNYIIDLFNEINQAYDGNASIFDNFSKEDLILAFFPCTRFENQILLWFRGDSHSQKGWTDEQKLENCLELHNELHLFYSLITKLALVCIRRGLRLIIENPYSEQHYLNKYWCIRSKFIDYDRSLKGDYYKKPTQYWFINCEPQNNFVGEPIYMQKKIKTIKTTCDKVERSMISPDYARRFILENILEVSDE